MDEYQLMKIVKDQVKETKNQGQSLVSLPLHIIEQLIEKAERPHD